MALTTPSYDRIRRSLSVKGVLGFGGNGVHHLEGTGFPRSGTTYGDGYGYAGKGSTYHDRTRGTHWINTGSASAPYWQPAGYDQPGMWGFQSDFRETQATALSDTTAKLIQAAAGYRIFGDGTAQNDGGALQGTMVEGGTPLRMTASATVPGLAAIGMPEISGAGPYQPDQHGMGIMEAYVTQVSAITLRAMGIGFVGLAADGMVLPVTAATTVATLVQDDLALMHFDVGYTATSEFKLASNKSDEAATMTAQATGVVCAAAATAQLLRVEVYPDRNDATKVRMVAFVNKAQVGTIADALDEDEEANPVLYIASTSAAIKAMDVFRVAFVTGRLTDAA